MSSHVIASVSALMISHQITYYSWTANCQNKWVMNNDAHTHGKTANYFNCLSRHYSLFKCAQTANVLIYVCASGCVCVCMGVCDMYSYTHTQILTHKESWAIRQTHTSCCLHRHETCATEKRKICCRLPHLHTKNSLSLSFVLSLSFSPICTLALSLFLCSVSVSHLISENKY